MFRLRKGPSMPDVDPQFVLDGGSAVLLIDVRETHEFDAGHAALACSAPLSQIDTWMPTLPTNRTVVCICRSGRRSAEAADRLRHAGFNTRNLTGGMASWVNASLAVVTASGGPGRVV